MPQADGAPPARRLSTAAALLTPAVTLTNLAGYALAVVASRHLGADRYGELASLLGVLLVTSVPALAIQVVVAREVVLAAPDERLVHWARRLGIQVGIASTLITLAISPLLSRFLQLHGNLGALAWLAVGLLPLGLAGSLQGLFQGRQQLGRLAVMVLGTGAAKVAGGVIPVALGAGPRGVLAGIAVGTLGVAVVGLRLAGSDADGPPFGPAGFWVGLAHACGGLGALLLLANLDVPLARHTLDSTQAGRYAVGAVISKAAFWLPQAIALVALPGLAERRGQRRKLREALALVLGIGAVATIGAALLGKPVLAIAFGDQYRSVGDQAWRFALQGSALSLVQLLLYGGIAAGTRRIPPLLAFASAVEAGLVVGNSGSTVGSVINLVASVAVIAAALAWLATPHGPPERDVHPEDDRRAQPPLA